MKSKRIDLSYFLAQIPAVFTELVNEEPWTITANIQKHLGSIISGLGNDYTIKKSVAIHRNAQIEEHVILKGPVIISDKCFIGSHAYLRGGVFLANRVSVGPGCEIKSSYIMPSTALAHFNFVGDSLIGSYVNMEAGSVIANHYNEREDKRIFIKNGNTTIDTGSTKFGALVGDHCKIGANAVLSPGTILQPKSIVKRLELIEQSLSGI